MAEARPATPRKCPICGKPPVAEFAPFCSARCQDVDLNRWLSGAYVIPAKETDPDEAEDDSAINETDGEESA